MIICIGREFGSGGHEIGRKVAEKLGLEFYDRDLIDRAAEKIIAMPKDVLEKADEKKRNTAPMKRLNPAERQNNLKKAFNIGRNDVKLYDRIILVDDIYTTGTTLDEIAALLKSHGVSEVYCVTLACGAGL